MNQCPLCKITFPDEQVFCSECGAKLVPVRQEQNKEEKRQEKNDPKPAKAKASKAPMIVLALLLLAALIGDLHFYSQASDYSSQYWDERITRISAEDKVEELENNLTQTENKLSATQDLLDQAEAELERYSDLSGAYGYGSDNFYAFKNVLVLKKSETKRVKIYWNGSGIVYQKSSSSSGIKSEWSQEWSNSTIEAIVTGRSVGYYTITFTNDQDDESFAILVIVQS